MALFKGAQHRRLASLLQELLRSSGCHFIWCRNFADSTGDMASNDSDLNKLTVLMGQCLGRIDEEAFLLQEHGTDVDFATADRLDSETETLYGLVDSMLSIETNSNETNVNQIVTRVTQSTLQELSVPVVLRQALTTESSQVQAPTALVNVAVQRAMALAVKPLGPGDELRLTTRIDCDSVLIEIESRGSSIVSCASDRVETLREFVEDFDGTCQMRQEGSDLFLVLELPQVMATDRSESL